MSTLRLPGLLTGVDTGALISQLMAIERSRMLYRYEQQKDIWDERKSALSTLESKLSTLRSSVRALSDAAKLRSFTTASSDTDKLTAEASYNAFEGNHTVVINQLATAERWVHTAGLEYTEDYVGAGTFIYSYNHKETTITTTAETTLEDFVGLINNDANNPGVTASLLYYNDAYHLVLSGNDGGTDYQISINASSTEVWEADSELTDGGENATLSTKIIELDQFSGTLGTTDKITINGTDKSGIPIAEVELIVTSNTKITHLIGEINDAFDGVAKATFVNGKIILTDDTCGASDISISLEFVKDPEGDAALTLPTDPEDWDVTEGGSTTASGLNSNFEPADFIETQSAQDSEIRVDGYPSGAWISRSSNTVDDVIHGVTLHLHDTTEASGEQITLTRNIQSVKDKLNTMVTAYNSAVFYIQEKTGYNDTLKTAGVLMTDSIVFTIRDQLRTPLITRTSGFIEDIDTFLMAGQIGLELDGDGMLSLNTATFNEAISEDYMGVLALIGADKTGSSDSNDIKFYGASSRYTTAGSYRVKVEYAEGNIDKVWIKLSTENDSQYRQATIDGNVATGNSSFDNNSDPVCPENGLQLTVPTTGSTTIYATVRVKQGFTGTMEDALDRTLKTATGSLQIDQEYVDLTIKHFQSRIETEEDRLADKEEKLIFRFARLESTLALIQSQMGVLGML